MNRAAALSIRYGIALARQEASYITVLKLTEGDRVRLYAQTEARLLSVVRLRYRRVALNALYRTRITSARVYP